MLCTDGTGLLRAYQQATQDRVEARDRFLLSQRSAELSEKAYVAARAQYNKAFVNWVTHRGHCVACRTASIKDDLTQFASV